MKLHVQIKHKIGGETSVIAENGLIVKLKISYTVQLKQYTKWNLKRGLGQKQCGSN